MISNLSDLQHPPSSSTKLRALVLGQTRADTAPEVSPSGKDRSETERPTEIVPPALDDRWKRLADLAIGIPLGIVLLPFILLTAAMVKLTSPGPAFYTQTRVGRFGHRFPIYKIRTMQHNCEHVSGVKWATKKDPRVTRLGKILRKTHLDELPQILNVLKGDMSLVGPRPERPEFTILLEASIPHYKDRMLVRPGVTGLAQVFLPPDSDVNSVRQKLVYDLRYIAIMNLWLDLRLMLATFAQAIGVPCRLVQFVLWLPSMRQIESPLEETEGSVPAVATQS
jgi:lipopolysaccharide/colanic/teichoic acid biosynthesis glycosyltransferase